jgi:predicted TPR repeat methyltransferase
MLDDVDAPDLGAPTWLGDEELHRSHRSNLLRKFPDHYASLFENDLPDDLPYVWPEV